MSTGLPPKEENDSSTLQPSLTDVYGNAVLSEKDEDQNRGNQTETSSDEIFIVEEHSDEELYDDSGDDDTSKNLSTPKDILDAHEKLYAALFEWNDADAVAELLKKGTSIDAVDSAGRTVLHRIVGESENEDLVESLLLNGADRWKSDNFGSTPLMEAVRYSGTADVIQMLVRGIRDKDSNTTEEHRLAVFQEDKNRVNSADTEGRTALHWAAGKAEAESIRRLLLSLGADKSKKDKLGRNPLVHAIQSGATEQTVRLLASGIDLESRDTEENTALHHAVKERNFSAVDVLLDLGADIHSANLYGRTALHEAVKISHDGTLKLLLQHKAKPNRKDYKGATALMLAAEREKPSLIQTLLNNGAKVEATDNRGKTAVHYAIQGNQLKSLEILLENDAEVRQYTQDGDTALHIATYEGNTTLIWPLLDHGAELEAIDASGRTPLLEAILKGRLEIMKILLAAGADRNFRFKPSSGKTALEIVREDLKKARELAAKDTRRKQRGLMKLKKLVHESSRQIPVLESMEEVLTQLQGVSSNIDIQKQLKVQSIPVSNYALDACKGFQGVVVDFLAGRLKKNLHGHASVYELLYGGGPEAVIQSLRLYGMNQNRKFRWHHLPANNLSWVEALITRIYVDGGHKIEPDTLKRRKWLGKEFRGKYSHSFFLRPHCATFESSETVIKKDQHQTPTSKKSKGVMVFMPYLTYESIEGRNSLKEVVAQTMQEKPSPNGENIESPQSAQGTGNEGLVNETRSSRNPNEKLVQGYLKPRTSWGSHALHIRRTLDQFFFHDLPDVGKGSADDDVDDQTVGRYAKRNNLVPKIFMVDQLWLWILDDKTIITSFPQNWNQDPNKPEQRDVLNNIQRILLQPDRRPLLTVFDLAALIVQQCTAVFDRNAIKSKELQFMDMFEASIEEITNSEIQRFNDFKMGVLKAETMTGPHTHHDLASSDSEYLKIAREIDLKREIRDIQDELDIINVLLDDQSMVAEKFHNLIHKEYHESKTGWVNGIAEAINTHKIDVSRMHGHATRTHEMLNNLLDLKVKQATVFEAQLSRMAALDTVRQGQTILVFTIVTIIFLPMSFLSSFFALPVSEFPKGADDSSNALPLNWVSKYIFGITLAVATFFIYIALDVTRVVKRIRDIGHAVAQIFRQTTETKVTQADGGVTAKPTTILIEGERLSQLYHRGTGPVVPNTPQQPMAQAQESNVEQPGVDFVQIIDFGKVDEHSSPPAVNLIQLQTPRQLEEGKKRIEGFVKPGEVFMEDAWYSKS